MGITTKQFQKFTDLNLVWDFLVDIYEQKKDNGVAAPFFEHAIKASWVDSSYSYLDRLWFDGDKVVAFVFYEAPVTDIYFNVRPGYEFLADELIDYAITTMPDFDNEQQFVLFGGQDYLKHAAEKRGYKQVFEYDDLVFDFENELNYELPEGYHFVEPKDFDVVKLSKLCWYGFGHGDEGEFKDYDKYDNSLDWTPAKSHKDIVGDFMAPSPHSTGKYAIVIADRDEEYVCFSGMWWIPENKLAAAALTKHYRRMKALGATHMTGGGDPFYAKIGYGKGFHWSFWKKVD